MDLVGGCTKAETGRIESISKKGRVINKETAIVALKILAAVIGAMLIGQANDCLVVAWLLSGTCQVGLVFRSSDGTTRFYSGE